MEIKKLDETDEELLELAIEPWSVSFAVQREVIVPSDLERI
jgi:hypothetical protein